MHEEEGRPNTQAQKEVTSKLRIKDDKELARKRE